MQHGQRLEACPAGGMPVRKLLAGRAAATAPPFRAARAPARQPSPGGRGRARRRWRRCSGGRGSSGGSAGPSAGSGRTWRGTRRRRRARSLGGGRCAAGAAGSAGGGSPSKENFRLPAGVVVQRANPPGSRLNGRAGPTQLGNFPHVLEANLAGGHLVLCRWGCRGAPEREAAAASARSPSGVKRAPPSNRRRAVACRALRSRTLPQAAMRRARLTDCAGLWPSILYVDQSINSDHRSRWAGRGAVRCGVDSGHGHGSARGGPSRSRSQPQRESNGARVRRSRKIRAAPSPDPRLSIISSEPLWATQQQQARARAAPRSLPQPLRAPPIAASPAPRDCDGAPTHVRCIGIRAGVCWRARWRAHPGAERGPVAAARVHGQRRLPQQARQRRQRQAAGRQAGAHARRMVRAGHAAASAAPCRLQGSRYASRAGVTAWHPIPTCCCS